MVELRFNRGQFPHIQQFTLNGAATLGDIQSVLMSSSGLSNNTAMFSASANSCTNGQQQQQQQQQNQQVHHHHYQQQQQQQQFGSSLMPALQAQAQQVIAPTSTGKASEVINNSNNNNSDDKNTNVVNDIANTTHNNHNHNNTITANQNYGNISNSNNPRTMMMCNLNLENAAQVERVQLLLTSFTSLLSSAETNGVHHALTFPGQDSAIRSLNNLLSRRSSNTSNGNGGTCDLPCLKLRGPKDKQSNSISNPARMNMISNNNNSNNNNSNSGSCNNSSSSGHDNSSNNKISLHEIMALNLSTLVTADAQQINSVPKLLLQNTSDSFRQLISSRLRVSIQAITRTITKMGLGMDVNVNVNSIVNMDTNGHFNGTGASSSSSSSSSTSNTNSSYNQVSSEVRVLRKLLTSSNPISITTVVTSFQTVPNDDSHNTNDSGKNGNVRNIVRPIVFETVVDMNILGKIYTITLEAPGTISASLSKIDFLLQDVHIVLDTMTLLRAMISQARAVVKKALKRAATITTTVATYRSSKKQNAQALQVQQQQYIEQEDQGRREQNQQAFSCGETGSSLSVLSDFFPTSSSSSQHKMNTNSGSNKSSKKTNSQNYLLESYPEHLRETVQHFLPAVEMSDQVSIEGFPPNLLQTLQSLSGGCDSDDNSGSGDGSQVQQEQQTLEQNYGGLFSWMNNDGIMLKQQQQQQQPQPQQQGDSLNQGVENNSGMPNVTNVLSRKRSFNCDSNYNNNNSNMNMNGSNNYHDDGSIQQPLSKRNKKVSFILPSK